MKKTKRKAKKTSSKKKSHAGLIVFAVVLVLLIGAYGAGGFYFSQHFLPGTTLNNSDVSGLTLDEAKELLLSSSANYNLTLLELDYGRETISGADVGLTAIVSENFNRLLDSQSGLDWILKYFGDKDYILEEGTISYDYDDEMLEEIIDELECVNPQYPVEAQDAEVVLMDGEFKIIPESIGNTAHRDILEEKIRYAIETQQTMIDLQQEGLYDMPEVYADDEELLSKKAVCDDIVDMTLTLQFGMREETVDIQTIVGWVKTVKNDSGEYVLQTIDDKIKEYVDYLCETYDTYKKPKAFNSHSGSVVEITSGDYGWKLDSETAQEKIKALVLAKQSVTVELTNGSEDSVEWWERMAVGYDSDGNDYYGTTYAEVSIDEQHMWMYRDGSVVLETDVVTGNPNLGNDTPKGAYKIRYHQKDAILRGPGYASPVSYWMVFADDVGFHDATWQPRFGGDFYLTNGSHGCVNMPLDQAAKLFDLIYDGMPVFVY